MELVTAEVEQQEIAGCHEGQGAELLIVLCVVGDNNVASGCKGTLILQHVLVVLDLLCQGGINLTVVHWKDFYAYAKFPDSFVSQVLWLFTPNISEVRIRKR